MSKEAIDSIDRHIGQLFLNFAFIDQALDFWLMAMFPAAIKHNIATKMPHLLGQKIDLVMKCCHRLKGLRPMADQISGLLTDLAKYNEVRNTIAHGAISHYQADPIQTLVFAKLRYSADKGVHIMKDHVLSFTAIAEANEYSSDIVVAMHKMVHDIHAALEA